MTAQDAYEGLPHTRCILRIGVPVGVSLSAQDVLCGEPLWADLLTGGFDIDGGAMYETGNG